MNKKETKKQSKKFDLEEQKELESILKYPSYLTTKEISSLQKVYELALTSQEWIYRNLHSDKKTMKETRTSFKVVKNLIDFNSGKK